jgi:3-hydroxybutyrate dehydrogenase
VATGDRLNDSVSRGRVEDRSRLRGELAGRVALITGGAGGFGLAIGRALSEAGAGVALFDLRAEAAASAVELIRENGADAIPLVGDVTDEASVGRAFAQVDERWGRLDILVNNAGFQHVGPIDEYPIDLWRRMLDVHLTAAFLTTRLAIPGMKARRWGRLIYMSSINGKIGNAYKAAYCAAKHGLIGLAKTAALELAEHGITSNAICPGYANTEMIRGQLADLARLNGYQSEEEALEKVLYPQVPQHRLIEPEEVAELAAYLCGEGARGITGQAINVSGGLVMH